MDRAKALVTEVGEDCPAFWVRTDHQTAGRGRRRKPWSDRSGDSLLVTLALRRNGAWDPCDPVPATLALRAAVAVFHTVSRYLSPDLVTIKWPNDILVADGKVCGLLVDADRWWYRIGIGLNVGGVPETDPSETGALAPVCLREYAVTPPPLPARIFPVLATATREALQCSGWRRVAEDALAWRGRAVVVEVDGRIHRTGVVHGITEEGALLIGGGDPVYSGTVRLKGER